MPKNREKFGFPTRNYPYRYPCQLQDEGLADAVAAQPQSLQAGKIYRFVLGLDDSPQPLSDSDAAELLGDPFAELLLKRGTFPLSLEKLLAALNAFNNDAAGLPTQ